MQAGRVKEEFSYQCQSCQNLLPHLPKGICSICGSYAVVPLGWSQRSTAEHQEWLTRIYGGYKKKNRSVGPVPVALE